MLIHGRFSVHFSANKWIVYATWFLLITLNLFCVLYSLGIGTSRDHMWQQSYVYACIIQIVVESFLFESMEVTICRFLIPSSAASEVHCIQSLIVNSVISELFSRQEPVSFDCTKFLFVSKILAKRYSNIFESFIVNCFRSNVPTKSLSSRQNNSCVAKISNSIAAASVFARCIQRMGALPICTQRLIVRGAQPFIMYAFLLLIYKIIWIPLLVCIFGVFFLLGLSKAIQYFYAKVNNKHFSTVHPDSLSDVTFFPSNDLESQKSGQDSSSKIGEVQASILEISQACSNWPINNCLDNESLLNLDIQSVPHAISSRNGDDNFDLNVVNVITDSIICKANADCSAIDSTNEDIDNGFMTVEFQSNNTFINSQRNSATNVELQDSTETPIPSAASRTVTIDNRTDIAPSFIDETR